MVLSATNSGLCLELQRLSHDDALYGSFALLSGFRAGFGVPAFGLRLLHELSAGLTPAFQSIQPAIRAAGFKILALLARFLRT